MGLTVGGETAWRVFSKGEVGLAFHWVQGEPSMVLFPTKGQMLLRNAGAYVLPLSRAHQFVKDGSDGDIVDADVLWQVASKAAEIMGFHDDYSVISKVADLVLNHLDDLCDMPPEPAALAKAREPAPTGGLAVRVDGQTVFEGEA